MNSSKKLLYQIIFTLDFGIQQQIFVDIEEAAELLDLAKKNQIITFKHIQFHSKRILSTQLFKLSLVNNKYEPFTFIDFAEERGKIN
jgi:hypothetical protein